MGFRTTLSLGDKARARTNFRRESIARNEIKLLAGNDHCDSTRWKDLAWKPVDYPLYKFAEKHRFWGDYWEAPRDLRDAEELEEWLWGLDGYQ